MGKTLEETVCMTYFLTGTERKAQCCVDGDETVELQLRRGVKTKALQLPYLLPFLIGLQVLRECLLELGARIMQLGE